MKLVNLTPHAITIHAEVFAGFSAHVELPASGTVARITVTDTDAGTITVDGVAVPVTEPSYGDVSEMPPCTEGVGYVVSRMVAERLRRDRTDLYIPGPAVRDAAGRVVGCRGLCQIGGAS